MSPMTKAPNTTIRYIRLPDIAAKHGITAQGIHKRRRAGLFPEAHYPPGHGYPHWDADEIDAYFEANPLQRGGELKKRFKPWTKIADVDEVGADTTTTA